MDAIERIDRPGPDMQVLLPAGLQGPGNPPSRFHPVPLPKIHGRYIDRLDCVDGRSDISPIAKAKQQRSQGHFSEPTDQIIIVQG